MIKVPGTNPGRFQDRYRESCGYLVKNPALIAKAPKLAEEEIEPYGIEEIQRLLRVASERRNSARWAVALALGLRQCGALGLKWDDLNLDKGTMRVRRGRLRPKYAHGCGGTCCANPATVPGVIASAQPLAT